MEQISQQTIQKSPFPIKTKIAAWWMIIIGIMLILLGIRDILKPSDIPFIGRFLALLFMLFPFLLSLYGGISLLKRKKWIFVLSTIVTAIIIIFSFSNLEEHYIWKLTFFSNIPIFILLLLDRKNFWKIAK